MSAKKKRRESEQLSIGRGRKRGEAHSPFEWRRGKKGGGERTVIFPTRGREKNKEKEDVSRLPGERGKRCVSIGKDLSGGGKGERGRKDHQWEGGGEASAGRT